VLKESFKIYCAVNDGIINLVDVVILLSSSVPFPVRGLVVNLEFWSD
jgi:hypothetical protein